MSSWMWKTNPTVKLVDLRAAERIRDLNLRKSMRNGSIPFKEASWRWRV